MSFLTSILGLGDSNSSTSTTQNTTTNQYDQRTVTDARQENTTTTNNITSLDAGAIDAAKTVSLASLENNATNTASLFAAADKLFSSQERMLSANVQLANSLAGNREIKTQSTPTTATLNKTWVMGGVAVAAILAGAFLLKK